MPGRTTVDLDPNEVALIVGEGNGEMTVRVAPAKELEDDQAEIPTSLLVAVALATRLCEDPDFQDDVLDWYESREEGDGEEDGADAEPEGSPS